MLDSEAIKAATKCGEVHYAHPYSSWNVAATKAETARFGASSPKVQTLAS
jgi:hypothetical protein